MFNRFYQPDIDVEQLEVVPRVLRSRRPQGGPPSLFARPAMARVLAASYRDAMVAIIASVGEPRRRPTYDDVLTAPEHQVAEILEGELFLSPRPATPHANASSVIGGEILGAFHGPPPPRSPARPGGWWILHEPELHLRDDVVVPDLAGWRRERMPRLPNAPWIDLAPDWLCETLSPSTAAIDRGRKLRIYAREGVAHVWLVDPLAHTLEVFTLDEGRWLVAAVHTGSDSVRAEPFGAIELDLSRLWID